jgi:hypothetical protein
MTVIITTIYYKFWFVVDLIIVIMHMAIVFLLTVPCFAIILISKVSYAPFSLYNDADILTM